MDTAIISQTWTNRQREDTQTFFEGVGDMIDNKGSSTVPRIVGKKNKLKSKRKCKRFKPDSGAFALIRSNLPTLKQIQGASLGEIAFSVFKAKPSKMGQIMDLNPYGLSFHYIDNKYQSVGLEELDILLAERGFYLERVPFKIVSDTKIPPEGPDQSIKMRRLGVQFKDISVYQKDRLKYFLQNHTSGTA